MSRCTSCGTEIPDGAPACPNCGTAAPYGTVNEQYSQQQYNQQQPYGQQPIPVAAPAAKPDSGSIGWAILGFFIPIVGLILFLVWRNTKPNSAKVAGIGAIIGFVVNLVLNATMMSSGAM